MSRFAARRLGVLAQAGLIAAGLLAGAGAARADITVGVPCTDDAPTDAAALVQAFHDANVGGGGTITLAAGCTYTLTAR